MDAHAYVRIPPYCTQPIARLSTLGCCGRQEADGHVLPIGLDGLSAGLSIGLQLGLSLTPSLGRDHDDTYNDADVPVTIVDHSKGKRADTPQPLGLRTDRPLSLRLNPSP